MTIYGTVSKTFHTVAETTLAYVLLSKFHAAHLVYKNRILENKDIYSKERQWTTFNVMLVEKQGQYYERRAIGQIHEDA